MKAFRITYKDQYIQDMSLNRGTYTYSAWVLPIGASYSIGVKTQSGNWLNFDLSNQIITPEWRKVKLTFTLYEPCIQFSLMNSDATESSRVHVLAPMLEEGTNAGTHKPNELDLDELASAGSLNIQLGIPFYKFQTGDDNKTVYNVFDIPIYATKNGSPVTIQANQITVMTTPPNGLAIHPGISKVTAMTDGMNSTVGRIQIRVVIDGINYFVYFEFACEPLAKDGKSPYIGENGNWWVWDSAQGEYVDSGDPSHGDDGKSPEIRDGYWWAWDGTEWYNTGVKAEAENAKWLKLNSTATQIKVDRNNNSLPASITVFAQLYNMEGTATWTYSVDGGTFTSTAPTGVVRTGNQVVITSANVTFQVLSIKAVMGNAEDTVSISRVVDGSNGLPGKLPIMMDWIQGDTHYNNDTVVSYVYYRAGNTWWRLKDAYTERVATASPSTTYYQQLSSVEHLVTKVIIAEQGNLAGLIFKDNKLISQKGMINGEDSEDYANPAFSPYIYIDGNNGEMVANKLLNPFIVADPDIAGDLQEKLTNNHNIYLEASGQVTYEWKEHTLPGTGTLADKRLDGLNIKIYAPGGGGNNRIKIVPAGSGMIFGDVPGGVVPSLKLVMGARDNIHLSAVWDRFYEVLDWVVTSRTGYRIVTNQGGASEIRVPNVFKENDIIAKGNVSTSGAFYNLLNRYEINIVCSVNSGRFTLSIPRNQYLDSQGALVNRTMSEDQFDLQVIPNSSIYRNTWVYKRYGTVNGITGVHFDIEFRTYNGSTPTATPFRFVLRALDYVFNNSYLDDTL